MCDVFFKPNHRLLPCGLAAQLGQLTVHTCYVPAIRVILPVIQYLMDLLCSQHFGCGGSEIFK